MRTLGFWLWVGWWGGVRGCWRWRTYRVQGLLPALWAFYSFRVLLCLFIIGASLFGEIFLDQCFISGHLEVNVEFLIQIDKLVQLIESPIFTCEYTLEDFLLLWWTMPILERMSVDVIHILIICCVFIYLFIYLLFVYPSPCICPLAINVC